MKMQYGLSANKLKLIAILTMTADHLAWTLWPGYDRRWFVLLIHFIGRVTAPIMWYFIAEGYHHTRSVKRYGMRLFTLALVSHFAYNFCFGIPYLPLQTGIFNQTGVVWSLAWGLVLLWANDNPKLTNLQKMLLIALVCFITFPSDWSCIAAMAVFFMGANRGNFRAQMFWMVLWTAVYAVVYFLFLDRLYGLMQLGTCLAIPLLRMYNGQKGRWKAMGKVFYLYYPAHLIVCGLLKNLL